MATIFLQPPQRTPNNFGGSGLSKLVTAGQIKPSLERMGLREIA